ncbi:hypothetical protein P7C70_g2416, partial [Phenoliferia sp. Uapishka_3]
MKVMPEIQAFLNMPFFPETGSNGPRTPLTIHIHASYHPEEKNPRRQFRIQSGGAATKESFAAWALDNGYLTESDAVLAATNWKDAVPGRVTYKFTSAKVTGGSRPSYHLCQKMWSGHVENLSISAFDPRNANLKWAETLSEFLWEEERV